MISTKATVTGTLGNILWMTLGGGAFMALGYLLGGLLLCCTIIGIPLGVQVIKLGVYALMPFDKRVVSGSKGAIGGTLYLLFNIGWFVFFGLALAIGHLMWALLCAITIIGIPFAVAHLRLAMFALMPFGKEVA